MKVQQMIPPLRRTLSDLRHPWQPRDRKDNEHIALLIMATLRRNDVAIDLGANIGFFLMHMLRVAPDSTHFAFEPIPHLAQCLREEFPAAHVSQIAIADFDGTAPFEVVTDKPTLSSLDLGRTISGILDHDERRCLIDVEVRRLDSVVPAGCRPALIKIDVEGREIAALRGATRVLREAQPVVVFEHGDVEESGEAWDILCGHADLRMFSIDGDGPFDRTQFVESTPVAKTYTWVAKP